MGWTAGESWFDSRQGKKTFHFPRELRSDLGAPSQGIERPRCEGDHLAVSSAEIKKEWSYTSIPWVHRDNWLRFTYFAFNEHDECNTILITSVLNEEAFVVPFAVGARARLPSVNIGSCLTRNEARSWSHVHRNVRRRGMRLIKHKDFKFNFTLCDRLDEQPFLYTQRSTYV